LSHIEPTEQKETELEMKSQTKSKKITRKTTPAAPIVAALKPAAANTAQPVVLKSSRGAKPKTEKTRTAETTIEAKIDVGFGNHLYLRGQGAGLSWERGTPLTCVDGSTWRLSVPASEKFAFKLLLNDQIWASGEDIVANPGKRVEIVPTF
jgi:hypothetical protein